MTGSNQAPLLSPLIDRIVRMEEEKKGIGDDIKDAYAEGKSNGFNPRAIKNLVRRRMESQKAKEARIQTEEDTETYANALNMLD